MPKRSLDRIIEDLEAFDGLGLRGEMDGSAPAAASTLRELAQDVRELAEHVRGATWAAMNR